MEIPRRNVAVAARILIEVFLVIDLGGEKVFNRLHLDRKGLILLRLDLFVNQFDVRKLAFVGIIDAGAVLNAAILTLPIDRNRVDNLKISTTR